MVRLQGEELGAAEGEIQKSNIWTYYKKSQTDKRQKSRLSWMISILYALSCLRKRFVLTDLDIVGEKSGRR